MAGVIPAMLAVAPADVEEGIEAPPPMGGVGMDLVAGLDRISGGVEPVEEEGAEEGGGGCWDCWDDRA